MKPEYSVQRSLNLLFQHTLFLMFHHFQKYLDLQCFLTPLSFKINLRDTSFHISLNFLGFYLSRMLVEFSDFYITTCAGKSFQFMVFPFLENALNLCNFTHAAVPHSKLQVESFENPFPPRQKRWRKLWWLALSKFNQKIWRWLGTLIYLHFVWFVIFLNVMVLQFCK